MISGGLIWDESDGFVKKDLWIEEGRIVEAPGQNMEVIDATGLCVLPGLIDLHMHGCAGFDTADAAANCDIALQSMAEYQLNHGIAAFVPTTMTLPLQRIRKIVEGVERAAKRNDYQAQRTGESTANMDLAFKRRARILGVHLEGPFISGQRCGAQDPQYAVAPAAKLQRSNVETTNQTGEGAAEEALSSDWQEFLEKYAGFICRMTIAPELPGALDLIRKYSDRIRFSVGHTDASYEQAVAAFDAGAGQLTHLFNAMPGLHHRKPGPIAAAVEHPEVFAELISDGIHVAPSMVRLAFQLFSAERMILISDSSRAAGMPDGEYELGGQPVFKHDGAAFLSDGTLASSATDLYDCMRRAISFGIRPEDAIRAASLNPARALGVDGDYGSLRPGHKAILNFADANDGFKLCKVVTNYE